MKHRRELALHQLNEQWHTHHLSMLPPLRCPYNTHHLSGGSSTASLSSISHDNPLIHQTTIMKALPSSA